jgi:hypothetical protein
LILFKGDERMREKYKQFLIISFILIIICSVVFSEQSAQNYSGKWIELPGEDLLFVPRLKHLGRSETPLEICDYLIAIKINEEDIRYFAPRLPEDEVFMLENVMKNNLEVKYPKEFYHTIKGNRDPRWLSAYDPNSNTVILSDHILYSSVEQGSALIHEFGHLINFKYIEEGELEMLFDRCLRRYKAVSDVEVYAVRDWLDRYGKLTWSAVDWELLSNKQRRIVSSMLFPSVYSSTCLTEWWAEVWTLYNIERERKSGDFVFFELNPEVWDFCEEIERDLREEYEKSHKQPDKSLLN